MKTKEIKVSFEQAKEWYKKGGELRKLATSLFDELELLYGSHPTKEEILKKFEKNYPIGSIVWSSDGTDNLPNIIVSKPRLEKVEHYTICQIPYRVVFDTYRIYVYDNSIYKSSIKIEGTFNMRGLIEGYIPSYKNPFDKKRFKKDTIEHCQTSIERRLNRIEDAKKEIAECETEIKEYQEVLDNFDNKFNSLIQQVNVLSKNER